MLAIRPPMTFHKMEATYWDFFMAIWGCDAGSFRWWQSASQHHNQRPRRVYDVLRLFTPFFRLAQEEIVPTKAAKTALWRAGFTFFFLGTVGALWLLDTERVHFAVRCLWMVPICSSCMLNRDAVHRAPCSRRQD